LADSPKSPASHARQSLYYLLGAALQGTGALLVQPFSIRILDSTQWGRVGFSAVLLQVGQVVLSAGLPLAITRAYFVPVEGKTHARAIHGANVILSLGMSFLAAAAFYLGTPDREAAVTFALAIAATGLLSAVVSSQAILRSQQRALAFVFLSGGASLGAHLCGLIAISVFSADSTSYMAAFLLGMAATAAVSFVLARPLWPAKAWAAVKSAFRLGLPVLPHSIAIMLLMQGDSFLVQHFQDSAGAGRYIAAAAFALGPFAVLSSLNNVWTARIFEASHKDNFRDVVRQLSKQAALISGALVLAGTSAATIGMLILKGDDPEVILLAKVLPAVGCGYALYLLAMSVMFAMQKTSAFSWVTPLVLVLAAAAAFFPAQGPRYWELGAVKAAAFAALGLFYYVLAIKLLPASIPLRPFVLAAGLGAMAIAANFLIPDTLLAGLVSMGTAGIICAAGFLLIRKRV
jgi:O-antigen/teichoic acid export membrane protein